MPYRAFATPALLAAFLAAAAPALAQDVSYPPSRALGDIAAWLQRDTPILPGQVVDVSPSAVTAVTAAQPTGQPRGFLANIVSEAVDPQILTHEDVASWSIPVEVDCEKRTVRLGVMTGFHTRDLRTDPRTVRDADDTWVNPVASAPLGAVMRALCDREFRRPFEGRLKVSAAKAASAPKTAPAPASAPPAPAADAPRAPALRSTLASASPAPPRPKTTAAAAATPAAGVAVQIGASPDPKDAQALLARAKARFGADIGGHETEVVTAEVDGKTVHRALITGFGSAAEATCLCEKLKVGGQACFVRR